jgi:hypothetical protein
MRWRGVLIGLLVVAPLWACAFAMWLISRVIER